MKKIILLLGLGLLFSLPVMAESKCFIAKENGKVLKEEGECQLRYPPESTFKIPLSLMGYDAGIFEDETHPEWPFKKEYDSFLNICQSAHNPKTWMRDSCVWYSQVLTMKLGMEKFKEYVIAFDYGNQDLSGEKGKNNGLTNAWLGSSLEISPKEQTIFLQKLLDRQLSVSAKAYDMTQKILFREELAGGWMLYGKTGNNHQLSADRTQKLDLQHGWFVGWIEKDGRRIVFASHINDDKKQEVPASFRIRDEAKNKLWALINALER